jgi:tetratricopeptide (TPR) repeat protein
MVNILEAENAMSAAYKSGDFDTAYARAKDVVEANRGHVNGLRHLARIATNRRDLETAQAAWRALTEVDPNAPEPWLQLARIAHRDRKTKECLHYLDPLLALQPDNVEARTMQVESFLKERDESNIKVAFEALCELETKNSARLARIAVNYGMGTEIAPTLYKLANDGDQEAINLCDSMFRAERDAGIGFEIQKNPFSAARCYRTMRTVRPESDYPQTCLARLRRPFLERARRAYAAGEYERAIEHGHSCIKIDDTEAEPYIISGRAAHSADDGKVAFEVLNRGVERCAEDGWLKVNFARAASRQNMFLAAILAYADVLNLSDEKSKKHHKEAKTAVERLTTRLPQQALRDVESGSYNSAVRAIQFLIEQDPYDAEALRLKSNVSNQIQRKIRSLYDENDGAAIGVADDLILLDSTLPYPYRVAGRMLYASGSFEKSRDCWNALIQLDDSNFEYWLMKARCSVILKDPEDALLAAQSVLDIDESHEEAKSILKSVT